MATTAGAITTNSVDANKVSLTSAPATAGTAPYTYQWHRSTANGFSPSGATAITGATALTLVDTTVVPNSQFYYKLVATDAGAVSATSSQISALTPIVNQQPNSFGLSGLCGVLDGRQNFNSLAVVIDSTELGTLIPGQLVKVIDSQGGVPKVVAVTSDTDEVFGVLNYDAQRPGFKAGMTVEVSQAGNIIYMYSAGPISRASRVVSAAPLVAAVAQASGASKNVVGYALDKATAGGQLIRIHLRNPSFTVA